MKPAPYVDLPIVADDDSRQLAVFTCPSRLDISRLQSTDPWAFLRYSNLTQPELKLTVNFTELLNPSDRPGDLQLGFDTLLVYLALTNNTRDVMLSTAATPLLPGVNIVGFADVVVRQRLEEAHLSTLGLFDVRCSIIMALVQV